MATVYLPRQVASLTGGVDRVEVRPGQYRAVMAELDERFPGLRGALERDMMVAIDGEIIAEPLLEPVGPDSEVHFLARISGG